MNTCTYLSSEGIPCGEPAPHAHTANGDRTQGYIHLCDEHHALLIMQVDAVVADATKNNARAVLGHWVKAMGGAAKATDRLTGK